LKGFNMEEFGEIDTPSLTKITTIYDGVDIQPLRGLEAVRHRPAMYIGDVGIPGLHQLFKNIFGNAIDEVITGRCDQITVTLHPNGSLTVQDNGEGIWLKHLTATLTEYCCYWKFHLPARNYKSYKFAGMFNGHNLSCVSALSEWMETTVWQAGRRVFIRTERGVIVSEQDEVFEEPSGTQIRFKPDPEIFGETQWSAERLLSHLGQQVSVYPHLTLTFLSSSSPSPMNSTPMMPQ
jgi:DNA gyrase subunit B